MTDERKSGGGLLEKVKGIIFKKKQIIVPTRELRRRLKSLSKNELINIIMASTVGEVKKG